MKFILAAVVFFAFTLTRCAEASPAMQPNEPTAYGQSFFTNTNIDVVMCVVGTTTCGPVKSMIGDGAWHACGLPLAFVGEDVGPAAPADPPAGAKLECRPFIALPPSALIPDGWNKLADACTGCTFDIATRTDVKLCSADYLTCSATITILKSPGAHFLCKDNFKDFPASAIPYACIGKPNPVVIQDIDLPTFDSKWWNSWETGSIPDTVSTTDTHYIIWRGSTGRIQIRSGTIAELIGMKGSGALTDNTAANAWQKTHAPIEETDALHTYLQPIIATFTAKFAEKWVVQNSTTLKRPYYKPNATMTNIGTQLGYVAQGTLCDQNKRLGTTNYYWVPSVGGYATCALLK